MAELVIKLDLSDHQIHELKKHILQKTAASIDEHIQYFLKPWIQELSAGGITESKRVNQKIYHGKKGYTYALHLNGKRHTFTCISQEPIIKFKKEFEKGEPTAIRFNTIKQKYKKYPSKDANYIYHGRNQYNIQMMIKGRAYTFITSRNKEELIPIRDYILWHPDKPRLYQKMKGRNKIKRYTTLIAEDKEYQKYLKEKQKNES